MADVYQLQAKMFANALLLQRDTIAYVHLEGDDDKVFWNGMLQEGHPGKYRFVTYSRCSDANDSEDTMAKGVSQCLKFRPNLSKQFFICIDSDMRYLLQEPDLDATHFVCQTYTYSWENHYCEAKALQKRFMDKCSEKACQFDFEAFLSAYSSVVYKPLLLLLYCLKNHRPEFGKKMFSACLPHQCRGNELADNGRPYIERISKNFEQYLNTPFVQSIDFETESNYYQSLNVNEQNAYLHIRGHNLFDLVTYIGDLLCHGTSVSFRKDVLMNELPPQTYWQIKRIISDISEIV